MLTNVMEGVQRKCEQYWPEARQSETYGPFEVTVVDQKVFADCTIRTLQLEVCIYNCGFKHQSLHQSIKFFCSNLGWWVFARR